ncbi:MAG: hypothetical protein QXM31_03020 [Candidatus Woesearchaeota archaeon]
MEEAGENHTARHLLAVILVAVIGLAGLLLMFKEAGVTAQAMRPGISDQTIVGCNQGEVLLSDQGVAALKQAGRAKYGPDFSPYNAARINYNGVGYCANAAVVQELLG